jgi:hypothetical protein
MPVPVDKNITENCGKAATQLAFTINMKSTLRLIRSGESNGAKEPSPLVSGHLISDVQIFSPE